MANPVCTLDTLVASATCFFNFNPQDRAALKIYFDSLQLTAIGGTAYTLGSGGTLEEASKCFRNFGANSPFYAPTPYQLAIAANNATAAGAAPATTKDTLATAIACLHNFPEADLTAMQLLLYCALGRGKAYPQ